MIEAVLQSARKLIAEQGPGVGLRDIADDAGVNFGLIYQYLGTKEQLVREVYERAARSTADRLADVEHLDDALAMLMTFGDGTAARLLGWAALESKDSAQMFGDSPALDVLARLMVADADENGVDLGADDAKAFAALAMAIAIGWRLFAPTALSAAGLDGAHPEHYQDTIQMYIKRMAAAATNQEPATNPARRKAADRRSPRSP